MRVAGIRYCRRVGTRLAVLWFPPYVGRSVLATLNRRGFIAPGATLAGSNLRLGSHVLIDDEVVIHQHDTGQGIEIGDRVRIDNDTYVRCHTGGSVTIGTDTHIHRGCEIIAGVVPIEIGCGVQIAARCAVYSYDHGMDPNEPIANQPLQTKGPITIADEAWLGYGVIVLSGVRIGAGAVVGAGAIVTHDVPAGAIAAGVPARVIGTRTRRVDKTTVRF
jgi:acetyltransferase-like isoleucine patch superfamily enzyme